MKTLDELLAWRRSIRKYDATKGVSREEIEQMVAAAIEAPSWKNCQTTRYHVATSGAVDRVKACLATQNVATTEGVQALVVVTFKHNIVGFERSGEPTNELGNAWGTYDAGLSNAFFLLKAAELGVDTIVLGLRDAEALRQTLNIPEEQSVVSVIGLGHRIETPDRPKRKTVDVIATFHE
ncbi:MAG: nitroreductase family protein [Bacteroidaceae bacterium]|nr:nitroreductase family protein [Bacteroidaceae bacterium]